MSRAKKTRSSRPGEGGRPDPAPARSAEHDAIKALLRAHPFARDLQEPELEALAPSDPG